MSLVINTNVSSLKAQRSLAQNTLALNKSLQRLSSGARINSSKDDAAGLQIANKLTSKIRGNQKAMENAQDGLNLLGVLEGTYSAMSDILLEMRTMLVQAGNDTLGTQQRTVLQNDFFNKRTDLKKLLETTAYNGKYILNDPGQDDTNVGFRYSFSVDSYSVTPNGVTLFDDLTIFETNPDASVKIQIGDGSSSSLNSLDLSKVMPDLLYDSGLYTIDMVLAGINLMNATDARENIANVDSFSQFIGKLRSDVGTFQNQLTNTVNTLTISNENYAAAKSRIMDVDVAKESANLTRNQILQQASASVLTQANQQSSLALNLLQGGLR